MTMKCQMCGSEYKFCPECERGFSYKKVVDNPTCYKVYVILYELREGIIDKQKAKEELDRAGITERKLGQFIGSVQKEIETILKTEEKVVVNQQVKTKK